MKFAILSVAATAALALSADTASAQWRHHHQHHNHGARRLAHDLSHLHLGPHLDYHNGHLHYHNGFYRSAPLYPDYGLGYPITGLGGYRTPYLWNSGHGGSYYRGNAFNSYRWGW